jgi:hypothetical protein
VDCERDLPFHAGVGPSPQQVSGFLMNDLSDLTAGERAAFADRIEQEWYQVRTRDVLGLRPRTLIVSTTDNTMYGRWG